MKDVFKRDGFIVKENVLITGYSGVEHYFPLLLSKGNDNIVIEYSDGSNIEIDVAKLSLKCRDSDIQHAILILNNDIPISDKVSKMAEENGIKIMESSDIRDMVRAW